MAKRLDRVSEGEVGRAVLFLLAHMPKGEATVRQLIEELPDVLELSSADLAASQTRNGEAVWEQQVRNLISHRTTAGNIIAEGYAIYLKQEKKLRITPAGWSHLHHQGYDPSAIYSQA